MKTERAAPANVQCTIRVDYPKRTVTRDGKVVCKFVSSFQQLGPNIQDSGSGMSMG